MNLGDVERQLRAGPPEEELYRVRALVVADERTTPAQRLAVPRSARALAGLRLVATLVVVVGLVGAGFVAGRLSVASPAAQEPAAVTGMLVRPAYVSDALRRAFHSGVDRQRAWLVCAMTAVLTCVDAPTRRSADRLGDSEWHLLDPVTVPSGHIVVGAQLDPALQVAAYLGPWDNPSGTGPELVPITISPGDTFLDLGALPPGAYVLSVLTSPSSPTFSGQVAIGIDVQ
jgi:hypothetical protein